MAGCFIPPGGGAGTAREFLSGLGKDHLLIGASMDHATAGAAPFEVRYLYISGGVFDSFGTCPNCGADHHCGPGGTCCPNSYDCHWWGCWQWDQLPPGQYLRDFIAACQAEGQIPFISYYQVLQSCGAAEGAPEVAAAADPSLMARYLADWRFLLQNVGNAVVLLQIEPDFWGYAQHLSADPRTIPAAVASADAVDGTGHPDTMAGLGQCLIAMARRYAPNARVSLHASGWASGFDCLLNRDPLLDVAGEARKTAAFLAACGDADFVTVDVCDRDAGYYQSIGRDVWWDPANAALPHFTQFDAWLAALTSGMWKAAVVWQVPVGNMGLPDAAGRWRDNRVDYFFSHMAGLAAGGTAAVLYGAGAGGQTTPETDGGNLINRTSAYMAAGGQRP